MKISLRPVTVANRGDLEDIDPGPEQRYWVHSNWYWHQWSIDNPHIVFRLIHVEGIEAAVGMVAYGPFYRDEALTEAVAGEYEIIHLVIDHQYHGRGYGKVAALAALRSLLALPDCQRVVVANHPDNTAARAFFRSLGFVPIDRRNYDGDPMMEVVAGQAGTN